MSKNEEESRKKAKAMLYGHFVKATGATYEKEKDFSIKISDEELLRLCGGRTAHRGARIDQSAKIKRADKECVLAAVVKGIEAGGTADQGVEGVKDGKKRKKSDNDDTQSEKKSKKRRKDDEKKSKKKRKSDSDTSSKKEKKRSDSKKKKSKKEKIR